MRERESRMRSFYEPTQELLAALEVPWICSYSGGKDSTGLVSYMEWLRRSGWIDAPRPRLVMSDTGVEFPFLWSISDRFMSALRECGWICDVVQPRIHEKLYNRIFGIGNTPIHPAIRRMRWCTRSTKIDPMDRFRKTLGGSLLVLTGIRFGESSMRDSKLLKAGCVAGGECGLPGPGAGTFAPVINWSVCQLVDWLRGLTAASHLIKELMPMTQELTNVYDVKIGPLGFGISPPEVTAARFGCIGCPAIDSDKNFKRFLKDHPHWTHLSKIYKLWSILRLPKNRLPPKIGGEFGLLKINTKQQHGPIKMKVRMQYFAELMKIQINSGVVLVTPEDEAFIRKCWRDNRYPRGWCKEDEFR